MTPTPKEEGRRRAMSDDATKAAYDDVAAAAMSAEKPDAQTPERLEIATGGQIVTYLDGDSGRGFFLPSATFAAELVRRYNAYTELLAACEAALELCGPPGYLAHPTDRERIESQLRAAILKAHGESK